MSKYNKLRGILSAKNGTHIPKFQESTGTLGNPYILAGAGVAETLPGSSILETKNPTNIINPQALPLQNLYPKFSSAPDVSQLDFKGFTLRMQNSLKTSFKDKVGNIGAKINGAANKFANSKVGQFLESNPLLLAMGFDMMGDVFNKNVTNSSGVDTAFNAIDSIGDVAFQANPMVGLAIKGFNTALKGINDLGGKTSEKFSINQEVASGIGGSYSGSMADFETAASKAGKKYGLFSNSSRKKANNQILEARRQQNIMSDIYNENQDYLTMSGNDLNYLRYGFELNGGYDQRYMRAAKQGAKLEGKINFIKQRRNKINSIINLDSKEVEWLPTIVEEIESFKEGGIIESSEEWAPTIVIEEWEPTIIEYKDGCTLEVEELEPIIVELEESVEEFKQGGKTKEESDVPEIEETTQKNVIPEGALHKNKHHIEHTEGLTLKGIPVVDNDGKQQAEVECEEIIFTLEVTKALEERYHKYYSDELTLKEKDELAIEAGKLLVREILYNTDDRVNLIEKCKDGGKL